MMQLRSSMALSRARQTVASCKVNGVRFFKSAPIEIGHPGYAAGTFSASTVDEDTPWI